MPSKNIRAHTYDTAEVDQLKLALQSMLDAYFRLTDPLPKKTMIYKLCAGAFGRLPEQVAKMLEGKR